MPSSGQKREGGREERGEVGEVVGESRKNIKGENMGIYNIQFHR